MSKSRKSWDRFVLFYHSVVVAKVDRGSTREKLDSSLSMMPLQKTAML